MRIAVGSIPSGLPEVGNRSGELSPRLKVDRQFSRNLTTLLAVRLFFAQTNLLMQLSA